MAPKIGVFLSAEEHGASFLVESARKAEAAGFESAWISDHFHPWTHSQGQSPFVWSVLGGIASVTSKLRVHTAVTAPTVRIHPAIIAQAAATTATMFGPGRFGLGVGTGEALNEHILGDPWPDVSTRLDMLEEAVAIIRALWTGEVVNHDGTFYTVDRARLFSIPDEAPPIHVSGFGPKAISRAAQIGDGFMTVQPDADGVRQFRDEGGTGTVHGGFKCVYHEDEAEARRIAHRIWPNEGLAGELAQLLPMPTNFEEACEPVTEEMVAESVVCGPDPERYVEQVRQFEQAGFDEVYVSQIGDDDDGFFRFWKSEVEPRL
ncbi:TIGR03557 family F420-dependent LLM class oxidoreductase [Conexibacter sp. SYSU D00693]|uniref:TIGR03557 family F420-dependent LLM class oxidoreductase n=1 Tax=Conexibacter sp. SYSU D00693 TaxID=2812560 RepID=UPI00196B1909|nr:TIGR03557 family F420-dependent LLM class oxidoreductase [Conexibacter sp. SYSU D00693]